MRKSKNAEAYISSPSQESKGSRLNAVAAPAATLGVFGAGAIGYYTGVLPDLLNSKFTPDSTALNGVVDGMVAVNEGIRFAAPVATLGLLGAYAHYAIAGKFSSKENAINRLSKADYSGVGDMVHSSDDKKKRLSKIAGAVGGVGVLSATLIMGTSGLEKDVTEGSLRPIHALTDAVHVDGEQLNFVLQSSNNTFMDDSIVPRADVAELSSAATGQGMYVIPFSKELMNIDNKASIELAVPDDIFSEMTGVEVDESCETLPLIVDNTLNVEEGGDVTINGKSAQVVAVKDNIAQMNRSIGIISDTDMQCLKQGDEGAYFGAIVNGGSSNELEALLPTEADLAVVEEDKFYENNVDFWRANGTPLILILMGSVAVLGAAASANERRSALMQNVREIGMLNASGVEMKDIKSAESRRALRRALYESAIAAPLAVGVAAAFNKSVTGLGVGIGLREVAVGTALTWASKEIAARRAMSNLGKQIDLPQAVKG